MGLDLDHVRRLVGGITATQTGTTLVVFWVPHGEIQMWSMAVNCRERDQPVLSFLFDGGIG